MREEEVFESFKGSAFVTFVFQTKGKDNYNVFASRASVSKKDIAGIYKQIRDSFTISRKKFLVTNMKFDKSAVKEELIRYRNTKMRNRVRSTGFVVFVFDADGTIYFTNDIDLGYLHKIEFDQEHTVHIKMRGML